MPNRTGISRREFVQRSASAVAGAAAVAASADRALGATLEGGPPIRVATIGCGGMGNAHLSTMMALREKGTPVEIVGVCDVYQVRLDQAAERVKARAYTDYRKVLETDDVDAVSIATPDHWHARIALDALNAGKDVYCEKPMTYWRNLKDARNVVEAVARNRRVLQVGTQGMSDDVWDVAGERIKAGAIGGLVHAQASDMRNGDIGVYSPRSNDGQAKPGVNLDWDAWLGPAPKHAWEPGRYFAWRSFWDYGGGTGPDFFPHILTPLVHTMGLTFPRRVTASGGLYQWDDGREVPDIVNYVIEYPGGPSVLLCASLSNDTGLPMLIRGKLGTLSFEGPGAVITPQKPTNPNGTREEVPRTRGGSLESHWLDFLTCVRSREKPRSNELHGYHVMTAIHMGMLSYLNGCAYEFDRESEVARPARPRRL